MAEFKVGDKVKCSAEYNYTGTTHLASFVRVNTYEIIQIGGRGLPDDRVVIGINGAVTAAVKMETLTLIGDPTPVPKEEPPKVEPDPPPPEISSSEILSTALENANKAKPENKLTNPGTGGGALMPESREGVTQSGDEFYGYYGSAMLQNDTMTPDALAALDRRDPKIVQNKNGFPRVKQLDSAAGYYRYDYYMNFEEDGALSGLHKDGDNAIRRALNIDIMGRRDLVTRYANQYNKFKLLNANDVLAHSFAHVFFVRPDCYLLDNPGTLVEKVGTFSEFYYALKKEPWILSELTQTGSGINHELGMYLSNKAMSFEISDEYITTGDYGESLTGFKVPYGKSNAESQAGGKFSITYRDDRDLHVYHLHKLWTQYISYVYRGKLYPRLQYIMNKVLDYPCCLYYFLTAEDGESIIFWTKYWGVFPIEAPSSGFSFTQDNAGGVSNPEIKLEYKYAWKEDFNPLTLIEFNTHTRNLPFTYVNPFQGSKVGTGYTWAGPPFVETTDNPQGLDVPYTFLLRFRPNTVNTRTGVSAGVDAVSGAMQGVGAGIRAVQNMIS